MSKRIPIKRQAQPELPLLQADRKLINQAERGINNLRHLEKLAEAMEPDPMLYEYRGEVNDAGEFGREKCSCGHPIRYIFLVRRKTDDKAVPIGSVCIETSVPWLITHGNKELAGALTGAVEKLRKQIAEAKRREKEAAASKQVTKVIEEFTKLIEWRAAAIPSYRKQCGFFLPRALFDQLPLPKANSTAGRTLAGAVRKYVTAWMAFAETKYSERWKDQPELPWPRTKKTRLALIKALDSEIDSAHRASEGSPWQSEEWRKRKRSLRDYYRMLKEKV